MNNKQSIFSNLSLSFSVGGCQKSKVTMKWFTVGADSIRPYSKKTLLKDRNLNDWQWHTYL